MWKTKRLLGALSAVVALFLFSLLIPTNTASATTGINAELSFEGKITTAAGINIPDGTYNMEFKIYTGCTNEPANNTGCTNVWTEDWIVGSSEGGVGFTSGTYQVNLGGACPFTTTTCESIYSNTAINWNSYPLYLSLQIGNTTTCTPTNATPGGTGSFQNLCGGDGEMGPYILLTSTPYAMNAAELGGLAAPSSSPGASQCLESGAVTYTNLTFGSCGGNLQQAYNGSTGGTTPDILLSTGVGALTIQDASTTIGTNLLDVNASAASGLGTTLFSVGNTGNTNIETTTNSSTAFQVQNSSSQDVFVASTSGNGVGIGYLSPPSTITAMISPTISSVTPTCSTSCTYTYGYEVTAVSANGAETLASTAVSTTTSAQNLSYSSVYNTVLWGSVTGASEYKVYRTSAPSGVTTGLIGTATGTSLTDYGYTAAAQPPALASSGTLTSGTTYYYEVTALDNNGGRTPASGVVSNAPSPYTSQTLSWASVAGARAYNVYRNTSNSFTGSVSYYTTYTNSFIDTNATATGTATPPTINTAYANNVSNVTGANVTVGNSGTATGQLYVGGYVNPVLVGNYQQLSPTSPVSIAVSGNYAYVADYSSQNVVVIFDISNPANPVQIGKIASGITPVQCVISGHYLYIVGEGSGGGYFDIYDISNPYAPIQDASVRTFGQNADGFVVTNNYAYVVNNHSGSSYLQTYNVTNPANPVSLGTISTNLSQTLDVVNYGNYLYSFQLGSSSLQIFSISNPASPTWVSSVSGGGLGNANTFSVAGHYLYGAGSNYFTIYDLSNPSNPIMIGENSSSMSGESLAIAGRYAYVASYGTPDLAIYDITNPYNPALVSSTNSTNYAGCYYKAIAIAGRYAYLSGNGGCEIQVVDIGGTYTQALQAGSAETGTLVVDTSAQINGDTGLQGDLTVAQNEEIDGALGLAGSETLSGTLLFSNTSNTNNVGLVAGATTSGYTLTLPTSGPTTSGQCLQSSTGTYTNLTFSTCGGGSSSLQAAYNGSTGGTTPDILLSSGVGTLTIQDASTTIGTNLLDVNASAASGLGTTLFSVGNTGNVTDQTTTNSSTAFQIQNNSGQDVLEANTSSDIAGIGYIGNPGIINTMITPTISSVTPTCSTSCTYTYGYEVTAVTLNGAETLASTAVTTTTSGQNLTGLVYNTISWGSTSASIYKIYRTAAPSGVTTGLIGTATGTSFADKGYSAGADAPALASSGTLTSGTTYYYEVTALDNNTGQTPASSVSSQAPSPYTSQTLSWQPDPGARGYNVYRNTSNSFTGSVSYYTTYTNSFIDTNATATGTAIPPTVNTAYANNVGDAANANLTVGNTGAATGQLYVSGYLTPTFVGKSSNGADGIMVVAGRYAYVADSTANAFEVYDLNNPANPVLLGSSTSGITQPVSLAVSGQYAYVVSESNNALVVFDISNPANPVEVGSTTTALNSPDWVGLSGHYAYVFNQAGGTADIPIFDISNPANPVEVGSYGSGSANLHYGAIYSHYIYADVSGSEDEIINIANPTSPTLVDPNYYYSTCSGTINDQTVAGHYLYIASGTYMCVWDLTNPTSPVQSQDIGAVSSATIYGISVQGRYAYLMTGTPYLVEIFDISKPNAPSYIGGLYYSSNSNAYGSIFVDGRYAYESSNFGAVAVYDIGGTYTQALQAGSTETDTLQVDSNSEIYGNDSIQGSIDIGGNAEIDGSLGIAGAETISGKLQFGNSSNAYMVGLAAGTTTASYVLTLPTTAPTSSGECLESGTGTYTNLTFSSCGAWGISGNSSTSQVIVGSGTTGESPAVVLILDNQNTSGDPSTSDVGGMYYNSSTGNFRCNEAGTWQNCIGGLMSSNTSASTALTATSATAFSLTGSIPANYCVSGRVIHIIANGVFTTTTASRTLTLSVRLGSTIIGAASPAMTTPSSTETTKGWGLDFYIICDAAPGSSVAVTGQGWARIMESATGPVDATGDMASGGTTTGIATSSTQTINIYGNWSGSGGSATIEQLIIDGE